jgi:hypothetical protein
MPHCAHECRSRAGRTWPSRFISCLTIAMVSSICQRCAAMRLSSSSRILSRCQHRSHSCVLRLQQITCGRAEQLQFAAVTSCELCDVITGCMRRVPIHEIVPGKEELIELVRGSLGKRACSRVLMGVFFRRPFRSWLHHPSLGLHRTCFTHLLAIAVWTV